MLTTATTTTHRQRYLRDALDQLYAGVKSPTQSGRQASIKLGNRSVSLETWEWDALVDWHASPSTDPALRWRTLVVEALALQSRFYADLERLDLTADGPAEDAELARCDLHLDAVLAFRILAELQRETERMVVTGGMDQAKRLTQFRRRLSECLTVTGKVSGEAALKEAEGAAAQSASVQAPERIRAVEDAGDKLQALFALEEQLLKREQAREFRAPEPQPPAVAVPAEVSSPQKPRRIRHALLAMLVVSVAAWVARNAMDAPRPVVRRELDRESFKTVTAIRDVLSRAPSLFVVVDTAIWKDLSPSERLGVVEQVASAAGAAGYSGAVIRTTEGAVVGQWLKTGGPRLLTGT